MKRTNARRAEEGFTLIELMVGVAIVGLLSSVAIPEYTRATLRARAAERATLMEALARVVNETVQNLQAVPANAGTQWVAAANPPGVPGAGKRNFNWTMAGWSGLPLFIEGDAYYSYSFVADDPLPRGSAVTLTVTADGDLDARPPHSIRTDAYVAQGYSFVPDPVAAHWTIPALDAF